MIRVSVKKYKEWHLIEEYFQSMEKHYVTGVHHKSGVKGQSHDETWSHYLTKKQRFHQPDMIALCYMNSALYAIDNKISYK